MAKVYQRYNNKIGNIICQSLADGKSWDEIAKKKGMPSARLMRKWLEPDENPHFRSLWVQMLTNKAQEACQEMTALTCEANKLTLEKIKKQYPEYNDLEVRAQLNADQNHRKNRINVLMADQKMTKILVPELAEKKTVKIEGDIAVTGTQILMVNYKNAVLPAIAVGTVIDIEADGDTEVPDGGGE